MGAGKKREEDLAGMILHRLGSFFAPVIASSEDQTLRKFCIQGTGRLALQASVSKKSMNGVWLVAFADTGEAEGSL